jgi:hypothetical protein
VLQNISTVVMVSYKMVLIVHETLIQKLVMMEILPITIVVRIDVLSILVDQNFVVMVL